MSVTTGAGETDEFASVLRGLKERSGLSYGALAKRLHMSTSTLHRYCNGTAVPNEYAPVERMARVCRATPAELVELHRRWILADAARERRAEQAAAARKPTNGRGETGGTAAAAGARPDAGAGFGAGAGAGAGAEVRPDAGAGFGAGAADGAGAGAGAWPGGGAGAGSGAGHAAWPGGGPGSGAGADAGVVPGADTGRAAAPYGHGGESTPGRSVSGGGGPAPGVDGTGAGDGEALRAEDGTRTRDGGPRAHGGRPGDGGSASYGVGPGDSGSPLGGARDGDSGLPSGGARPGTRAHPVDGAPDGARDGARDRAGIGGPRGPVPPEPGSGPGSGPGSLPPGPGSRPGAWRQRRTALIAASVGATVSALLAGFLFRGVPAGSVAAGDGPSAGSLGTADAPLDAGGSPSAGPSPSGKSPGPGTSPSPSVSPTASDRSTAGAGEPGPAKSTSGGQGGEDGSAGGTGGGSGGAPFTVGVRPYVYENPCSQHFLVDSEPEQVGPPAGEQDAPRWADAYGAVSSDDQMVGLTLQGTGKETVVLEAVHVRVISKGAPLAWNDYAMGNGCGGGVGTKSFGIDLDRGNPVVTPKNGQRGFPYKVSESDPEVFYISARTLAHDVRWDLSIDWSSGSRRGTIRIDNKGLPFRTSGDADRPGYDYPPGYTEWLVRKDEKH